MECPMCHEQKMAFWCTSCHQEALSSGRSTLSRCWLHRESLEQHITIWLHTHMLYKQTIWKQKQQMRRVDELKQEIEYQKKKLQRDRDRLTTLRTTLSTRRTHFTTAIHTLHPIKQHLSTTTTTSLTSILSTLDHKLHRYRIMLIDQLLKIYVVRRKDDITCSIVGLPLPDDCELIDEKSDEELVSSALGYVVFVLQQIATYLFVPLPYPMRYGGSHSSLQWYDDVSEEWLTYHLSYEKEFVDTGGGVSAAITRPFTSTTTPPPNASLHRFRRALSLLAHNILYLCIHCGITSESLRTLYILPNILTLIQSITLNLRKRDPAKWQEVTQQHHDAITQQIHHRTPPSPITTSHLHQHSHPTFSPTSPPIDPPYTSHIDMHASYQINTNPAQSIIHTSQQRDTSQSSHQHPSSHINYTHAIANSMHFPDPSKQHHRYGTSPSPSHISPSHHHTSSYPSLYISPSHTYPSPSPLSSRRVAAFAAPDDGDWTEVQFEEGSDDELDTARSRGGSIPSR